MNEFVKRCHTLARRIYLYPLYRKYKFDKWHFVPVAWKPYVKDIIGFISDNTKNMKERGTIIEFGCGLCDIVGNKKLKRFTRIGVDSSVETCKAAQELHKDIKIINGSFGDIKGLDIEYLIAVNFIHDIHSDQLEQYFTSLIHDNRVEYLILDEIKGGDYKYHHDFASWEDKFNFSLVEKMGPYVASGNGERYILVLKQKRENK